MLNKILSKLKVFIANRSYRSKNEYLTNQGARIGKGTRLNCKISSFGTEPFLIDVGKDCLFASNINLITHDGGIKVLNSLDYFKGQRMDILGTIKIGDNVYIGHGAYIMPGVVIGNNCIIGASAIVTKNIPDNSVAVGMPAKVIKNIDEYYSNLKDKVYPTSGMSIEDKRKYCNDYLK